MNVFSYKVRVITKIIIKIDIYKKKFHSPSMNISPNLLVQQSIAWNAKVKIIY